MQEIAVFILFFSVVSYVVIRYLRKGKKEGCASCDFNPEAKKN